MKNSLNYIVLVLLISNNTFAQIGKYLVLFKDKNNNTHSIANPLTFVNQRSVDRRLAQNISFATYDLPPSKIYIDGLVAAGATVWYQSRWANAALVLMDKSLEATILALPFVKGFEYGQALDKDISGAPAGRLASKMDIEIDNINYGLGTTQTKMLGLNHLHNGGFKGENMLIAVLDDGFKNVHLDAYMAKIFTESRVVDTYDFVLNVPNVYNVGGHGHSVLSNIAADATVLSQTYVGTAPKAQYALFRSENAPNERIIEEANYLFACERADSVGANIINTSLGYKNYDYTPYNHPFSEINGNTILSTRAADWAARAGILVCISAGNSGTSGIGSPADADSVLTVGAVNGSEIKASFSSIGPNANMLQKPTVSAMGQGVTASYYVESSSTSVLGTTSGTSFSSPIMAGFAACLWQANPTLKNMEIIDLLKNMGTQALAPDNLLGHGIPKIKLAINGETDTKNVESGIENTYLNTNSTRVIAQVKAIGVNPVSGIITSTVFVDNTVQLIPRPYLQRHFEINTTDTSPNPNAKITLFVSQTEFNNFNANNSSYYDLPSNSTDNQGVINLKILQIHGLSSNGNHTPNDYLGVQEIIDPADTDIVWNAVEKFWEISFPVTGFSAFFIVTDQNNTLPVNLISFQGKASPKGIELTIKTTNEKNFSHFEIEKTIDLKVFEKIGKVQAINNNNSEIKQYTFLDSLSGVNKANYYRLKLIDLNGTYSYSKVILITILGIEFNNKIEKSPIRLVQNPISDELLLEILDKNSVDFQIEVYDMFGKVVHSKKHKIAYNSLKISTLYWNSGEYFLSVTTPTGTSLIKFIKQ